MENQITRDFLQSVNHLRKGTHQFRMNFNIPMGEFKMLGIIHEFTLHRTDKRQCPVSGEDDQKRERLNQEKREPGIKVSELSTLLHSTRPATTKMLNSLEAKGYIERVTDTKDRRVVYVRLSESGQSIIMDALEKMHSIAEKIIIKMGNEDSRELIRLLEKLSQIVSEEFKNYRKE